MKPARFDYHRPASLEDALTLLRERPDAKPLAGGQSLIPAMNFRLAAPACLVDLNRLAELDGIVPLGEGLRIGALTRHAAVERSALVAERAPLLAEAMPHVAHPQIRSRGTIGGSLAHADPAAELPAIMVALEATLVLRSLSGERRIGAGGFFTGLFMTALEPGELVVAIELPGPAAGTGYGFEEFARRHGDYALVGVAAVIGVDRTGRCTRARIALLSVGDGPVLARRAMSLLEGESLDDDSIRAAAEAAAVEDIQPPSDIHATEAYRRQLARVLVRRAVSRATARARQNAA